MQNSKAHLTIGSSERDLLKSTVDTKSTASANKAYS